MLTTATILAAAALLSSCATGIASSYYKSSEWNNGAPGSIALDDRGAVADINGSMPDEVFIKTPTQTFCKGYAFCLVDGRIYYKPTDKSGAKWKLLTGTGIPHSRSRSFLAPRRIVEIAADADVLFAFSDEGRMYQCYFEWTTPTKPLTWNDTFGWPDKNPILQNDLVLGNRSWAVGTRRKDVLWYEDVYGNQHHFGTLGIETVYFLSRNGQEIRYADTGLPADFSHGILGPCRGSFIARSMSASASTIFLIGDSGEMYTRLADFDTLGNDPMFYGYTYERKSYAFAGSDYRSNFTAWALPSEDWKREPDIPLSGKAKVSTCITILQTGQGNFARELRVAGLSPEGESGYWHKNIRETSWSFEPCPLAIDQSLFVGNRESADAPATRGPKQEYSYTGSLWENGVRHSGMSFSIQDFPMVEGNCHLAVRYNDEECLITLYPVDVWTYMQRYNPGLDGTPKFFFITASVPDEAISAVSKEFSDLLKPLFQERNLRLFSYRAEATSSYFQMTFGIDGSDEKCLFLTRDGITEIDPNLVRQSGFADDALVRRYFNESLYVADTENLAAQRRSEVDKAIEENKAYRDTLRKEIERYQVYKDVAGLSRLSYNTFDFVATVTLLSQLNFPKIKTATRFGGNIMEINAAGYSFMAESRQWMYSKIIELLDMRIAEYEKVIGSFAANELHATISPALKNTYPEYFRLANLPERIDGCVPSEKNAPANIQMLTVTPLFPGLILTEGDLRVLIEVEGAAKTIKERGETAPENNPLRLSVVFHPIAFPAEFAPNGSFYGITGEMEWDGKRLRIWKKKSLMEKALIFDGSTSGSN